VASKDNFPQVQMLALIFGFMAASFDVAYDALGQKINHIIADLGLN
jgi:hypothetical protein